MDKYEWLELLGFVLSFLFLIVASCLTVTLVTWLLRLFFQLFGLL